MREEYSSPVGFASEPAERRRNLITRIITVLMIIAIGWVAWTRAIHVQDDQSGNVQLPRCTAKGQTNCEPLPGGG